MMIMELMMCNVDNDDVGNENVLMMMKLMMTLTVMSLLMTLTWTIMSKLMRMVM